MRTLSLILAVAAALTGSAFAQEQALFRVPLSSPLLGVTSPDAPGGGENDGPLAITASGFPAWAAVGTSAGGVLTVTGGAPPYGVPQIGGNNVPAGLLTPSSNGDGTWAVGGIWTAPGLYDFAYTVGDNASGSDVTDPIRVEVSAPLAVIGGDIVTRAGKNVSHVAVTGGYSQGRDVTLSGEPAWLAFDQGSGTLSGEVPADATAGTSNVSVSATDGYTSGSGVVNVQIAGPVSASYEGETSVAVDDAVDVSVTLGNAVGGVTWSVVSGSLPPGVTAIPEERQETATLELAGNYSTAGSYSVTLRGADELGDGADVTIPFTVTGASDWTAVNALTTSSFVAAATGGNYTLMLRWDGQVHQTNPEVNNFLAVAGVPSGHSEQIYSTESGWWMALGSAASASISTNAGGSWTSRTLPSNLWNGATAGVTGIGDSWVVVGANKAMVGYLNGTGWTVATGVPAGNWWSVAYGNGRFVASSTSGAKMMTSTNGLAWTAIDAPSERWWKVYFLNGRFIAISTGFVAVSTDGLTWTQQATPENNYWRSITYGNGHYVAVSSDGLHRIMTSTDAVNWTVKPAPVEAAWHSVVYTGSKFLAVAYSGSMRIMTAVTP